MFARIALALTVTAVLALVACGDDGPPDAAEIYADAGEKMATFTSYHVTIDGLDEGESFLMELDLVFPDRFQHTTTAGEDDEFFEFSGISIGDDFYQQLNFISSDWFIGSEEDRAEFGDLLGFAKGLLSSTSDLTFVEEEELDGVATYHLEGTLPREVIELVETEGPLPESIPVELWVGKDDSLVHRYVLSPGDAEEEATLTFSRFDDETISIEAPPDPLTAEELQALFEDQLGTPEDLQEAIAALSAEERECLIQAMGDDAFAELEAGERLLTEEEETAGEVCFFE